MTALARNRIASSYVETAAEVPAAVAALLNKGDTVAVGGSVTLDQTGVMDLLRNGDYRFLDRYAEGLTRDEVMDIFRQSFFADAYICSSNAVTMRGELYNVDGNSNRIAAIAFGPKSVIMVVGVQKLVPDLEAAKERVKTVVAPLNAKRLSCDTYCAKTGTCAGVNSGMTVGCATDARICCNYLVSAQQRHQDRIKVIFVGEHVGY
ncbi:MAG: lactate utilization protein [Clostridia bacterium]|nr:lactate utilization protein [Clostridia bacterium]